MAQDPLRKQYLRMRGLRVRGGLTVEQVIRETSRIAISDGRPDPRDVRRLRRGEIHPTEVKRLPVEETKVRMAALKELGNWHGLGHGGDARDLDREIERELERITGQVHELPASDVKVLPADIPAKDPTTAE